MLKPHLVVYLFLLLRLEAFVYVFCMCVCVCGVFVCFWKSCCFVEQFVNSRDSVAYLAACLHRNKARLCQI